MTEETDQETRPTIVAVHSYGGGVGRTSAVANIGYHLAYTGNRVLLWDFHLSAPGLGTMIRAVAPETDYHERAGFADYLVDWHESGELPRSLDPYVSSFNIGEHNGRMDILPAGYNPSEYLGKLQKIRWENFYLRGGLDLLINLMSQISALGPKFVLIDAEPGINDMAFTAILQLSNLVLLMHRNNLSETRFANVLSSIFARRQKPNLDVLLVPSMVLDDGLAMGLPYAPSMHSQLSAKEHPLRTQYIALARLISERSVI